MLAVLFPIHNICFSSGTDVVWEQRRKYFPSRFVKLAKCFSSTNVVMSMSYYTSIVCIVEGYMSPHYNVLPEAVCCCLLVNHVVYKHVTMTTLLCLRIPTHQQNFKFFYCFLFELWVSNDRKKKKKKMSMSNYTSIVCIVEGYMSPHYNVLPEAVCCCLLVNHVVYKHVTMTTLLCLQIPTHQQNFKFFYCFLFELWVSNDRKKKKKMKNFAHHSPIDLRWRAWGPSLYKVLPYLVIAGVCSIRSMSSTL